MISSKSYTSKSYIHFQICSYLAYFRHHKLILQSTFALSKLITFSHKINSEQNIHLQYLHFSLSLFTFIIPSISLFFHSKILNHILLSALKQIYIFISSIKCTLTHTSYTIQINFLTNFQQISSHPFQLLPC